MAVELTGTAVAIEWASGADPAAQNISIPSDCTAVYMFWAMYSAQYEGLASATLNSNAPDESYELANGYNMPAVGVAAWYNPPTGTQSLDVSWDGSPAYGPVCSVVFVKGGDTTWQDVGADQNIDANAVSVTVASRSDNLVLKFNTKWQDPVPGLSSNWTNIVTQAAYPGSSDYSARASYANSPGESPTVCDGEDESFSAVLAVSIPVSGWTTYVTDINIPKSIGPSGFAADGAIHVEPNGQFSRVKPAYGNEALNANHDLASGLVGFWLFNEGTGTAVNDTSGNAKHGSVAGTLSWANDGLESAAFGGTNHISMGADADFRQSSVLSWFVRFKTTSSLSSYRVICSVTYSGGGLWIGSLGDELQIYYNGGLRASTTALNLSANTIYNLAVVVQDGQTITAYLDGQLVTFDGDNSAVSFAWNGTEEMRLGSDLDWDNPGHGGYYLSGFWNRVITQAEAETLISDPYALFVDPTVQLTNDITRHKQSIVIHDPRIFTGDPSNPTDHLIGWWKCDDNAASTTVAAEVGSDGTLQGGDNTADISSSDSIRGTSLLLDGAADYVDLLSAFGDLTSEDEWTLMFKVKPNFAYDVSTTQGIFGVSDGTDYLDLRYDTDMRFELQNTLGSLSVRADGPAYSSDAEVQQWVTLGIHLNVTQGVMLFSINGEIVDFKYGTMSWSSVVSTFRVGRGPFSAYGNMYIDDIKLYDGCILPFGAYFTGNGAVNTSVVHSNVLLYWDCESTNLGIPSGGSVTLRNTGELNTTNFLVGSSSFYAPGGDDHCIETVTNNDKIDGHKGSASFWIYCAAYAVGETMLYYYVDDNNYLRILVYHDDATMFRIMYACNGTTINVASPTGILADSQWQHIRVGWADSDNGGFARAYVDGVEQITGDVTTAFVGDSGQLGILGSVASWGALNGGHMDQLYITNNPNTPQIPTVFGQPVLVPMIKVVAGS